VRGRGRTTRLLVIAAGVLIAATAGIVLLVHSLGSNQPSWSLPDQTSSEMTAARGPILQRLIDSRAQPGRVFYGCSLDFLEELRVEAGEVEVAVSTGCAYIRKADGHITKVSSSSEIDRVSLRATSAGEWSVEDIESAGIDGQSAAAWVDLPDGLRAAIERSDPAIWSGINDEEIWSKAHGFFRCSGPVPQDAPGRVSIPCN